MKQRFRKATRLQLTLGGRTVIRLGPRAGARIDKVSLAAPGEESFFEVDEAEAGISLLALLRGRIHVREAAVTGARLDCGRVLEFRTDSSENDGPLPDIVIDLFEVREAAILCADYFADFRVDRVAASAPANGPVTLEASGSVSASPVTLTVTGGRLEPLLSGAEFPFQAKLEHAEAGLDIRGTVARVVDDPETEFDFEIRVSDFRSLGSGFEVSLPDVGSLAVDGRVRADAGGGEFTVDSGTLGDTRFSATGRADLAGERVYVELSSSVQQPDLSPFLRGEEEQAPVNPGSEVADIDFSGLVDAMGVVDGALHLTVVNLLGLPVEVRSGEVNAVLEDGALELSLVKAELFGGQVDIAGSVDSREVCPPVELVVNLRDVDLATLQEAGLIDTPVAGQVSAAEGRLRSCGRSLSQYVGRPAGTMKVSGARLTSADGPLIDISRLEAALEPGEPTRATLSANIAGEPVQGSLVAGSLQDLLGNDAWPLELVARGAGSRLRVDGRARLGDGGFAAELTSELSAPEVGSLHRWVDVARDASLPLHAGSKMIVGGPGPEIDRPVAVPLPEPDIDFGMPDAGFNDFGGFDF
jgi:hypothetical protein